MARESTSRAVVDPSSGMVRSRGGASGVGAAIGLRNSMSRGDTVRPDTRMKALLDVGPGCNNRCVFCHTQDVRTRNATGPEVDGWIDRAAVLGCSLVALTGGEPTARPEILRWAARIAARGMDLGLFTNGRMLVYPVLLERLLRARLRFVALALHGGTAAVHDAVVRDVAFHQTAEALRALSGRGLDLVVATVVTRENVRHLRGVVDLVRTHAPDARVRLSLARPREGDPGVNAAVPDLGAAAEAVCDAMAYAGGDPVVTHEGFPSGVLPGYETRGEDFRAQGFTLRWSPGDRDFVPMDDTVLPDRVPRSNSYNYTLEAPHGALTGETHEGCP